MPGVHSGNAGEPSPGHRSLLGHKIWLGLVPLGNPQYWPCAQSLPGAWSSAKASTAWSSSPAGGSMPGGTES